MLYGMTIELDLPYTQIIINVFFAFYTWQLKTKINNYVILNA